MALLAVEKIACSNEAAFVMDFWISSIDDDGNSGFTNNNSGNYPVGQTRVFNLGQGDPSISEGSIVWPTVKAEAGNQVDANKRLRYAKNGQTATFLVRGTTLNFSVEISG